MINDSQLLSILSHALAFTRIVPYFEYQHVGIFILPSIQLVVHVDVLHVHIPDCLPFVFHFYFLQFNGFILYQSNKLAFICSMLMRSLVFFDCTFTKIEINVKTIL